MKFAESVEARSKAGAQAQAAQHDSGSGSLPFPCSQAGCKEFHQNLYGFCHRHRFHRFQRKICSSLQMIGHCFELVVLFSVQAAIEIQSRALLAAILLSLLPVTCLFLQKFAGISATSICMAFLAVAAGSLFYTALRFDNLQQRVLKLSLATEASYSQVLEATNDEGFLQVSTLLPGENWDVKEVRQNAIDLSLSNNYLLARQRFNLFQSVVCCPLSEVAETDVFAKIKLLDTNQQCNAASVDVLCCEVLCDGMHQVQRAWLLLKNLSDVQVVTSRDAYAVVSSQKCCQVVVSIEGYCATVFLIDVSLQNLEEGTQRGLCQVANIFGLLDDAKPQSWEVSRMEDVEEPPGPVFLATALLLLVALGFSIQLTWTLSDLDLGCADWMLEDSKPLRLRLLRMHVFIIAFWLDVVIKPAPFFWKAVPKSGFSELSNDVECEHENCYTWCTR